MLIIGGQSKLDLVAKPVSYLLFVLQLLVALSVIVTASRLAVPFASNILGLDQNISPIVSAVAVSGIVLMILGALLLNVPAARKVAYGIPARIKRLIFIACDSARSREIDTRFSVSR
jgi:GTPase